MGERKHCRQCRRPLAPSRWRRPKRFCSRRHQVRYWIEELLDGILG
ncbi:hypothetical protein [Streptomyces sp. t39]|nr:hypothetical protein [Streptomyces sp. t39]